MKKVYYSEPYRRTLSAKPSEATIFYPECGGQPGDRGWADNIRILDTKKADDSSSVYILEDGKTLDPDHEYEFKLDWEHRFKFMAMHTCQHMLSGLLFTMFHIGTLAVHLGDEYLTIEIDQDKIEKETIDSLVKEANVKIAENHKVLYHEMSHSQAEALGLRRSIKVEGDVRIVEIEGVDRIACGGVQVASTSEIRLVVYVGQEQIRGHVRLFFKCGENAIEYANENVQAIAQIREDLGCSSIEEISTKINKIKTEAEEYKAKYSKAATLVASLEVSENLVSSKAFFETDLDINAFLPELEKYDDLCLCIYNGKNWLIALKGKFSSVDFNEIRQKVLMPLNAKGGGRNGVFQGSSPVSIVDKFREYFLHCVIHRDKLKYKQTDQRN